MKITARRFTLAGFVFATSIEVVAAILVVLKPSTLIGRETA